jgi:hypothetical protein
MIACICGGVLELLLPLLAVAMGWLVGLQHVIMYDKKKRGVVK